QRFTTEIAGGRLTVLEVGISDTAGTADFWVCDDRPVWSSFDRRIASRDGSRCHRVSVETRPFSSVLAEREAALYCKVDVEGFDHVCVAGIEPGTRPEYVSMELAEERGPDADVLLLESRGYDAFKIVDQTTFRAVPRRPSLGDRLPARVRRRVDPGPSGHASGSSGPIGPQTHGRWETAADVKETWRALLQRFGGDGAVEPWQTWFDLHATVRSGQ
ncbi:MAG: hypothetical protein Q7T55_11160, partial [Solirubrobacteraceae bacterium]|nr:hypothetical protein [Solirubrobacteraceae bacterium]